MEKYGRNSMWVVCSDLTSEVFMQQNNKIENELLLSSASMV